MGMRRRGHFLLSHGGQEGPLPEIEKRPGPRERGVWGEPRHLLLSHGGQTGLCAFFAALRAALGEPSHTNTDGPARLACMYARSIAALASALFVGSVLRANPTHLSRTAPSVASNHALESEHGLDW